MAKAILPSLDGLNDALKSEYVKIEAGHPLAGTHIGQYCLKVDAVDGVVLENVTGLKNSLSAARTERDEWKSKATAYGDLTPEAARDAQDRLKKIGDDPEKKTQQQIEAAKKQLEDKHRTETERLNGTLSAREQEVNELLIDATANAYLASIGVKSTRLILPIIKAQCKVVRGADGKPTVQVLQADGKTPRLSLKPGNSDNMGINEFIDTLKSEPDLAPVFPGTGAAGAGAAAGRKQQQNQPWNNNGGNNNNGQNNSDGSPQGGSFGTASFVDQLKTARRGDATSTAGQ